MSENLYKQIHGNLNSKGTDELLEIWKANDRADWSDIAFDVIREILQERGVEIPQQNEPNFQQNERDRAKEALNFSELELKIVDDENPPAFYDPFDVIIIGRQLELVAKVMIGLLIISNLANFSNSFRIVQGYFFNNPYSSIVYILTFVIIAVNTAIGVSLIYYPLLALSRILKILMEMEFNSRKA